MRWPALVAWLGCLVFAWSMPAAESPAPAVKGADATAVPARLAIGGFATPADAPHLRERSARLLDYLTYETSHGDGWQVVERSELERAMREVSLSFDAASRGSNAVQVGKMLRADWLLAGSLVERDGTGSVVARLIDARTGVIRDLNSFAYSTQDLAAVSRQIANFAAGALTNRMTLEQRVFLSVGGFENLGLGNPFPELRKELRVTLEQAFRGSRVAMVERTMVDPLLNELRLGLAGLTAPALAQAKAQPAFILLDGLYQRVEDGTSKLNLVLRIQPIGQEARAFTFKEAPGPSLNEKIVGQVKAEIAGLGAVRNRRAQADESRAQLERGMERSRLSDSPVGYVPLGGYTEREDAQKRSRNITEAIEAFQAALLLDPDNTRAKLYLGRCLLEPGFEKKDQARDYLQEVVAAETNSPLAKSAMDLFIASYLRENDAHALELYEAEARRAEDPVERSATLAKGMSAVERLHLGERISTSDALKHLTNFVWAQWAAAEWARTNRPGTCAIEASHGRLGEMTAVDQTFTYFTRTLGFNSVAAARELDALLPSVVSRYPAFAPHIWSAYVVWLGYHEDTPPSPALLERLKESLALCLAKPEDIADRPLLFRAFMRPLRKWAESNQRQDLVTLVDRLAGPTWQAEWTARFRPPVSNLPPAMLITNSTVPDSLLHQLLASYLAEDDYFLLKSSQVEAGRATDPLARCLALAKGLVPCQRLHRQGLLTTHEAVRQLTNYAWAEWDAAGWARTHRKNVYGLQAAHPGAAGIATAVQGFNGFEQTLGRAEATRALEGLLPDVAARYPAYQPHLWSAYVIWLNQRQLNPSPAIAGQLRQALEFCATKPEQIADLPFFLHSFLPLVRDWSTAQHREDVLALANRMLSPPPPVTNLVSSRPYSFITSGGTSQVIELKLGQQQPPASFSLGRPVFVSNGSVRFACDGERIWLTDNFLPAYYSKRDGSVNYLNWPDEIHHAITCIQKGPDHVWFGTDGSGLIEVDKKTLVARRYTEQDGLVLPNITALGLGQGRLWIGFGRRSAGGVGYLDLASRRIIAYSHRLTAEDVAKARPPLADQEGNQPPRNRVVGVVEVAPDDVWVLSKWKGPQRFHPGKEEWLPQHSLVRGDAPSCLLVTSNYVICGGAGLGMQNRATQQFVTFFGFSRHLRERLGPLKEPNNFVVSVAIDGRKLWVGGIGFVGVVDLSSGKVDQLCVLDELETPVRCLEVDGDEVWVSADKQLFHVPRAPLKAVAVTEPAPMTR